MAKELAFRKEIVDLVPDKAVKILDVGCGYGDVGSALKRSSDREVIGIEIDPERVKAAEGKIDKVVVANIEKDELPLEEEYFDCLIFADVLEHMVEPLKVINRFKRFLKKGGIIVASLPNIRHISIIWDLVFNGKWQYKDYGLMDRGHLRFFTKKSVSNMFSAAGLDIDCMDRIFSIRGSRYINAFTFGLFKDFLTAQYVFKLTVR